MEIKTQAQESHKNARRLPVHTQVRDSASHFPTETPGPQARGSSILGHRRSSRVTGWGMPGPKGTASLWRRPHLPRSGAAAMLVASELMARCSLEGTSGPGVMAAPRSVPHNSVQGGGAGLSQRWALPSLPFSVSIKGSECVYTLQHESRSSEC